MSIALNRITIEQPVPYLPITIKQNEDFTLALTIIEKDEAGSAVVPDTTGWTVAMQVRKEPVVDSPVLVEASTANGRIVVGIQGDPGEQVNIDIKIPDTAVNAIPNFATVGEAGYDLLVTFPNGDKKYYLEGPAVLSPAYTR